MDWQKLLKDLDGAGHTQAQIAARCGVAQSTVSDLSRGKSKQPTFSFGAALMAMHAELPAPQAEPEQAGT